MCTLDTSESTEGDKSLFVVERQAWYDLCLGLSQRCSCLLVASVWTVDLDSVMQVSCLAHGQLSKIVMNLMTSMGMCCGLSSDVVTVKYKENTGQA